MTGTKETFSKQAQIVAGTLFVANEDRNNVTYGDDTDGVTNESIIADIEANNTFTKFLHTDAELTYTAEDLRLIEADTCGVGEVFRAITVANTFTFNLLDNANLDFVAKLYGFVVEAVAGALEPNVIQTQTSGNWAFNKSFRIGKKNANGSAVTINTLSGSVDGPLTENTDYVKTTDALGYTIITILDSANVTTEAQNIVIDYDVTPVASYSFNNKVKARQIPGRLYKFITCPNEEGKVDTYYFTNTKVDGEVALSFVNLDRNDFTGSAITLRVPKGANLIAQNTTNL